MAIYVCTSSLGRLGCPTLASHADAAVFGVDFLPQCGLQGEAGTLEDGVISSLPRTETEITCFFSNRENPEASLKGRQR